MSADSTGTREHGPIGGSLRDEARSSASHEHAQNRLVPGVRIERADRIGKGSDKWRCQDQQHRRGNCPPSGQEREPREEHREGQHPRPHREVARHRVHDGSLADLHELGPCPSRSRGPVTLRGTTGRPARIPKFVAQARAESGIQFPWNPCGTRAGRWTVATGCPKSWASMITRSLASRAASYT